MKSIFGIVLRPLVTLVTVAIASAIGYALWDYYINAPWTRDGKVRADVVAVAPTFPAWSPKSWCTITSACAKATCCSGSTLTGSTSRCGRPKPSSPASRLRLCRHSATTSATTS